jgi:hypothetical protein
MLGCALMPWALVKKAIALSGAEWLSVIANFG